jgi:hypothetical protein
MGWGMSRTVSWFSCGAASAVATKLAIAENPETIVVYCEVKEEHPDNARFLADCEVWFDKPILILGNDKYDRSIYVVFETARYLVGPAGARCTGELKKKVREDFQQVGDIHVFGYTVEEQHRADRLIDANNELSFITPLIDHGLTKEDCLAMVVNAGIELPEMYKLGYKNNNCRGCVKASSPAYWKKIEIDFPDYFTKMNEAEKLLGRSVCKIEAGIAKKRYGVEVDGMYWRPQLHELPRDIIAMDDSIEAQCGIFCHMAEGVYQ